MFYKIVTPLVFIIGEVVSMIGMTFVGEQLFRLDVNPILWALLGLIVWVVAIIIVFAGTIMVIYWKYKEDQKKKVFIKVKRIRIRIIR